MDTGEIGTNAASRASAGFSTGTISVLSTKETPNIPPELLTQIVQPFRPVYRQRKGERHHWQPEYFTALHGFGQFRLVNRMWNHVLTPLIYDKTIIRCSTRVNLVQQFQPIVNHPHLIRSLMLYFEPGTLPAWSEIRQEAQHHLTNCLGACINLRKLDLIEPDHLLHHAPTGQIQQIFGSLSSESLTTLVFRFSRPQSPSRIIESTLSGLGEKATRLREFEIIDVVATLESYSEPVSLPPGFPPPLEELTLHGLGPKAINVIFGNTSSREQDGMITYTNADSSPQRFPTSLRHLTLAAGFETHCDMTILFKLLTNPTGVGTRLVSLRIDHPSPYFNLTSDELAHLPIAITKACPSLRKFLFFVPFMAEWLNHIPPDLVELGILFGIIPWTEAPQIIRHDIVRRASPVVEMLVAKELRRDLKKIYVVWEGAEYGRTWRRDDLPLLRRACAMVGIGFTQDQLLK